MKTTYIGLANSPHDPAIAIVNNEGEILFAEGSERLLQNKRAWCSPADDLFRIKSLLKEHAQDAERLVIAKTWESNYINAFTSSAQISKEVDKQTEGEQFISVFYNMLASGFNDRVGGQCAFRAFQQNPKIQIEFKSFSHHLCHAANSCFTSPYSEGICVIVDNAGETTGLSIYRYQDGLLEELSGNAKSKASLGQYYAIMTDLCGFDPIAGEEWKVMGLAPYGQLNQDIYEILSSLHEVQDILLIESSDIDERIENLIVLSENQGQDFKKDLAYTSQYVYCELMTRLLVNIQNKYQADTLMLGGGCALNSSYNGTIIGNTRFKNLYIPSAPGDDGNAIGAALLAYSQENNHGMKPRGRVTPYLGTALDDDALKRLDLFNKTVQHFSCFDKLADHIAHELSQGKIVGWVQGRAEFGPRALGNRSILADPRNKEIKNILNSKVKFRESFRPFAPSILHEYGDEYFEAYQASPFMERTLKFKKEVLSKVPGVVHVNHTGRLQSVKREWNQRYYDLIKAFYIKTGVPILLNTSLNIMGKPIVHSVEDAVALFYTSGLDILVLDNYVLVK